MRTKGSKSLQVWRNAGTIGMENLRSRIDPKIAHTSTDHEDLCPLDDILINQEQCYWSLCRLKNGQLAKPMLKSPLCTEKQKMCAIEEAFALRLPINKNSSLKVCLSVKLTGIGRSPETEGEGPFASMWHIVDDPRRARAPLNSFFASGPSVPRSLSTFRARPSAHNLVLTC
jgi:hypothetical protein